MTVQTTRFGTVRVDESIFFPNGILGFESFRQFALIEDPDEGFFFWLQSCQSPEVAFPVLEPKRFMSNYEVVLTEGDTDLLGITKVDQFKCFSIITIPKNFRDITANLKAPILIHLNQRRGYQVVLQDHNLEIKKPIFSLLQQTMGIVTKPQNMGVKELH